MAIHAIPLVTGTFVVAVAALSLVGWAFDISAFREMVPGLPAIVPCAAVSLLLQGLSLLVFARLGKRPRTNAAIARLLAFAGLVLPVLTLFEFVLERPLGIDTLLFEREVLRYGGPVFPGRISPHTVLALMLSAFALATLHTEPIRARFYTQGCALVAGVLALLALVGYMHGVVRLFGVTPIIGMAMPAAVAQIAVSCGILALTPERGVTALLRMEGGTGVLVRRLFLSSVLVPLVLSVLIWLGERTRLFDLSFGHSLFIVAAICMYASLVAWAARGMATAEEARVKLAAEEAATAQAKEERDKQIRMSEALRMSEERLAQAVDVAGLGIFDFDHRSCTFYLDPTASRLLGYGPDEPGGIEATIEHAHPEDRASVAAAVQRAQDPEGDGTFAVEHRVVHPDGSIGWVSARAQTIFECYERRMPVRTVGAVLDITERKRAEEDAREAARRKDEFLATLAHELRNPLAPIRTGVKLIQLGPSSEAATKALSMMERQLGHMVRLIDDLLDVSRITRGTLSLKKAPVELRTIVETALEASRPLLDSAGHLVSVEIPDAKIWIDGDLTRLSQVVTNLVNNAAKYTPRGGHIDVAARFEDGQAIISVHDDGIGIAPETLPLVFDMFMQADRSAARTKGGLGVGLTLVKRLVEMHGGSVEAESPGEGAGSTFTVRLPARVAPRVETATRAAREAKDGKLRVLVVDDNDDAADMLGMTIELLGHTAKTAYSGAEALAVASDFAPDLILCDIGMPGMSGHEVCKALRKDPSFEGTHIVALTGWGSLEDRRMSKEAGFDAHLTKPVDMAKVEALIVGILGERRQKAPRAG